MNHTVTLTLNEEEAALVDALVRERGLSAREDVLRVLLHDALWDKAFAELQELLDQMADEAHAEYTEMISRKP